jgi:hypothetical protein
MQINLTRQELTIFKNNPTLLKNGVESYLIGGFVRDKILVRNLHKSFFSFISFKVKYL